MTENIRIYCSGQGLEELSQELGEHLESLGCGTDPEALAQADAVLHLCGQDPQSEIMLLHKQTSAPVILLVSEEHFASFDEFKDLGVADVLLYPQSAVNIVFAVKKACALGTHTITSGNKSGRVVTVFSPKGGSGKSMLALNMASYFAQHTDQRTLLLDLDLQFGDSAIMLDTDPKNSLLDLVLAHGEIDADKLRGFVTRHESGLHILPAPPHPKDADLVTDERLVNILAAAKQAYDLIIIDTPSSFNANVLAALDYTDNLVLVSTRSVSCIKNLKLCLQTLEMLQYARSRCNLVLNRADLKSGLSNQEIEKILGLKVEATLPSNQSVEESVNQGLPLVLAQPNANVSKEIRRFCQALFPTQEQKKEKGKLFGKKKAKVTEMPRSKKANKKKKSA